MEQSGRYETVDSLSSGAMGSVLLARDRILDRLVAIKTVNLKSVSDPAEQQRLQRALITEAQVVQLLSHPNIVTVHDVLHEPGAPAPSLVMEYVQGSNLEAYLKGDHALPVDFAISITTQVAQGLEHAHTMGVVHGDIKPSNILISDDGELAKIADFGIARLMNRCIDEDDRLLGTPRYISPEQILGHRADQRSDLFSLGVVLYEMLIGHSPFQGDSSEEITQAIARGAVDLSESTLREVPGELEAVLRRALERDPLDRFQSARQLAEALENPQPVGKSDDTVATQDLTALVVPEIPEVGALQTPEEAPPDAAVAISDEPPATPGHYSISNDDPPPVMRWALLATIAAIPTVLIGLLVIWFVTPASPPDGRFSDEHLVEAQVMPLFKEGQRQAQEGQPEVAIRLFRRAQDMVPPRSDIARSLQKAESSAVDQQARQSRDEELDNLLTESRKALDSGKQQTARRLATQALSLEPDNPEAMALMDAASTSRARKVASPPSIQRESTTKPKRIPEPTVEPLQTRESELARSSAPEPSPPPQPAPRLRSRPVPVSGSANLRVDVFSYLSKGVLTVYAGENQVLLKPFRFVQKSGFMRKKKTAGRLETSVVLPSGATEFRIYVSADGQETQTVNLAAELQGGQTHVLRLIIAENGSAAAQLN